jgi:hypothetical protein
MSTLAEFSKYSTNVSGFAKAVERALNPYEDKSLRVPFVLHSTYRQKSGVPPLIMRMNPSTVSFSQQKRISERKTQAGSIFFHWTNVMGENNDILRVSFSGQTGNINLRTDARKQNDYLTKYSKINEFGDLINKKLDQASEKIDGALGLEPTGTYQNRSGATRLSNFWNLYSLTAEPILDVRDGTQNISFIQFSSPLFGNTSIRLEGHFDSVLEITDDATSPFNARYSFSFTAISTTPTVTQIYNTVVANLAAIYTNELD